jgi:hypothetical protein
MSHGDNAIQFNRSPALIEMAKQEQRRLLVCTAALPDARRLAIWMANRKVSHLPHRVVRLSGSTCASRAEIGPCDCAVARAWQIA